MKASKKSQKKRKVVKVLVIIAAVLAILAVGVIRLRAKVTEEFAGINTDKIKTVEVTKGSISATVSGTGTLTDEDVEDIELYAGVEVLETVVEAGDKVEKGQLLARVNMPSVKAAMSELQSQINSLDMDIEAATADHVDDYISALMYGRVKQVYAEAGQKVADVMYEHGSLMILSLDGYMALDVPAGTLAAGDTVSVRTNGAEYEGRVDVVKEGVATVLITDDGPKNGADAAIDGVGSAALYIHKPLKVTGYAGTVANVNAQENDPTYSGCLLMTLIDTGYNANFESKLQEREELEEQLSELVTIYKEGAVRAQYAGSISAVSIQGTEKKTSQTADEQSAQSTQGASAQTAMTAAAAAQASSATAAEESSTQILLSMCPDKTMTVRINVDETDILSLSKGQAAEVTVDSVSDESFPGTVTGIEKVGTASNGVTFYTAEITLEKQPAMLAGMTASVAVSIEGVDDALIIPSEALHQTSSRSYVYAGYDQTSGDFTDMIEVTAGLNNGTYVEITSGLKEGDKVCYTPSNNNLFGFGGGTRVDSSNPGGQSGRPSTPPDMPRG